MGYIELLMSISLYTIDRIGLTNLFNFVVTTTTVTTLYTTHVKFTKIIISQT